MRASFSSVAYRRRQRRADLRLCCSEQTNCAKRAGHCRLASMRRYRWLGVSPRGQMSPKYSGMTSVADRWTEGHQTRVGRPLLPCARNPSTSAARSAHRSTICTAASYSAGVICSRLRAQSNPACHRHAANPHVGTRLVVGKVCWSMPAWPQNRHIPARRGEHPSAAKGRTKYSRRRASSDIRPVASGSPHPQRPKPPTPRY